VAFRILLLILIALYNRNIQYKAIFEYVKHLEKQTKTKSTDG